MSQGTSLGRTIQERIFVTEKERFAIGFAINGPTDPKPATWAQVRSFIRAKGTNGIETAVFEQSRWAEGKDYC